MSALNLRPSLPGPSLARVATASAIACAAAWAAPAGAASPLPPSDVECTPVRPAAPAALLAEPGFELASVLVEVEIVPPGVVGKLTQRQSTGHAAWEAAVTEAFKGARCDLGAPVTEAFVIQQTFTVNARQQRGAAGTPPRAPASAPTR